MCIQLVEAYIIFVSPDTHYLDLRYPDFYYPDGHLLPRPPLYTYLYLFLTSDIMNTSSIHYPDPYYIYHYYYYIYPYYPDLYYTSSYLPDLYYPDLYFIYLYYPDLYTST
jgi:hypothetical protein